MGFISIFFRAPIRRSVAWNVIQKADLAEIHKRCWQAIRRGLDLRDSPAQSDEQWRALITDPLIADVVNKADEMNADRI
jgi:hypothetical protein